MHYGDALTDVLAELSSLILSEESIDTTLQRIVDLSARIVPKAQSGVTLIDDGSYKTAAATDDLVREADALQYELGTGPCLHAISTGESVYAPDLRAETRWDPCPEKVVQTGVLAVFATPMVVRDQNLGCLNLYSKEVDAFSEADRESAAMFAVQASVALHNSQLYVNSVRLSEQLQEALGSRAVIDQAKGVLMERERVSADEAFEMLKKASLNANLGVRDIAQTIVDEALPSDPGEGVPGT